MSSFTYTPVLILGIIAFFMNCKPSEPFLTKFLLDEKNLTSAELENQVWPADTFGNLLFLLPVGLAADSWSHRGVILLGFIARLSTRVILIFGEGVSWMKFMQYTFALASATESVYFVYVYTLVEHEHFFRATFIVMFGYHAGNVVGSFLGQTIVNNGGDISVLFDISWMTVGIATTLFLLVWPPQTYKPPISLYKLLQNYERDEKGNICGGCCMVLSKVSKLYRYGGSGMAVWTCWYILAYSSFMVWTNYYQLQLATLDPNLSGFGYIEMANEIAQCIGNAFVMFPCLSRIVGRSKHETYFISITSVSSSILLFISASLTSSTPNSVVSASVLNACYMLLFGVQLTQGYASIAEYAKGDPRYPVIFTINAFIALSVASIAQQFAVYITTTTHEYIRMVAVTNLVLAAFVPMLWFLSVIYCKRATIPDADAFELANEFDCDSDDEFFDPSKDVSIEMDQNNREIVAV